MFLFRIPAEFRSITNDFNTCWDNILWSNLQHGSPGAEFDNWLDIIKRYFTRNTTPSPTEGAFF